MSKSFLDSEGLVTLWGLIKQEVQNKQVTTVNTSWYWDNNASYVPKVGEIVVYSDYKVIEDEGTISAIPGIKVGDGLTNVKDLKFISASVAMDESVEAIINQLDAAAFKPLAESISETDEGLPTAKQVYEAIKDIPGGGYVPTELFYVCSADEIDENGYPIVDTPSENKFYLTPSEAEGHWIVWIYRNGYFDQINKATDADLTTRATIDLANIDEAGEQKIKNVIGSTIKVDSAPIPAPNPVPVLTDKALSAENIPADAKAVGEKINELKGEKIDKPVNPPTAAGKALKVKEVNDDGTFACEWADDGSQSSMSENAIDALIECFNNVAWITDDARSLLNTLEKALKNSAQPPEVSHTYNLYELLVDKENWDCNALWLDQAAGLKNENRVRILCNGILQEGDVLSITDFATYKYAIGHEQPKASAHWGYHSDNVTIDETYLSEIGGIMIARNDNAAFTEEEKENLKTKILVRREK